MSIDFSQISPKKPFLKLLIAQLIIKIILLFKHSVKNVCACTYILLNVGS